MTPLAVIKYIVERLDGTAYAPWVNGLLFVLFGAVVVKAVSLLLVGKSARATAAKVMTSGLRQVTNRRGYSPSWKSFLARVEPYFEIFTASYLAFVGLYCTVVVVIAFFIVHSKLPWWATPLTVLWAMGWGFYVRVNLESLSWALHSLKERRESRDHASKTHTRPSSSPPSADEA